MPAQDYSEHKPDGKCDSAGWAIAVTSRVASPSSAAPFRSTSGATARGSTTRDNPDTTPQDRPFDWFRSRQVGGKSTIWGRQVYRWSDLDFEANAREGIAVDWPIRYQDLAKRYDLVV